MELKVKPITIKPVEKIANLKLIQLEDGLVGFAPLDEFRLDGTRGCGKSFIQQTATEMFIDLNFKRGVDNDKHLIYVDIENDDFRVVFHKETKTIDVNQTYDYDIDFKMWKAINKQVKELEWYDE